MKIRKTRKEKRGVYVYESEETGQKVIIKPGEDGVTEIDIKTLHALDDSEVYFNNKNLRPEKTEQEKAEIEAYKKKYIKNFKDKYGYAPHPEDVKDEIKEVFPSNYNLSLDYTFESEIDEDKSKVISATAVSFNDGKFSWSYEMEDALEKLTNKQREVIELKFVGGYNQSEIANILGVSSTAIYNRLQDAFKVIEAHFTKK